MQPRAVRRKACPKMPKKSFNAMPLSHCSSVQSLLSTILTLEELAIVHMATCLDIHNLIKLLLALLLLPLTRRSSWP